MRLEKTREEIRKARAKLRRVERDLLKPGKMVAGVLVERYKVCGRPGCRCARGKPHGPSSALSRPVAGRSVVSYVSTELRQKIEPLVKRYQSFQRHLAQWRKTVRELDRCFSELREEQLDDFELFKSRVKGKK